MNNVSESPHCRNKEKIEDVDNICLYGYRRLILFQMGLNGQGVVSKSASFNFGLSCLVFHLPFLQEKPIVGASVEKKW